MRSPMLHEWPVHSRPTAVTVNGEVAGNPDPRIRLSLIRKYFAHKQGHLKHVADATDHRAIARHNELSAEIRQCSSK